MGTVPGRMRQQQQHASAGILSTAAREGRSRRYALAVPAVLVAKDGEPPDVSVSTGFNARLEDGSGRI